MAYSPIRPYHLWVARALLLVGVIFTLYGGLELWQARRLVRQGSRGQAVVTGYKVFPTSGKSPTMYLPALRFVDPAGRTWQKDGFQSENKRLYEVGQTVEVIYPPDHPGDFKTNTFSSVWELGVVMVSCGSIACLLFYGLLVLVHASLDQPEVSPSWGWLDYYLMPLRIVFRSLGL